MVQSVGGPSPAIPPKKTEEKPKAESENKPENETPAAATTETANTQNQGAVDEKPADDGLKAKTETEKKEDSKPNTENASNDELNVPTGGLDAKSSFQVSQALNKPKSEKPETGNTGEGDDLGDIADKMRDVIPGDNKPDETNEPDRFSESVTRTELETRRDEAKTEMEHLETLSDPEKLKGGKFKDQTIFEAISDGDGKLTKEDVANAKSKTDKDLEKMKNGPLGMRAPDELIEKTEKLNKSLTYLNTGDNFEQVSGGKDYIDAKMLDDRKKETKESIEHLGVLSKKDNFDEMSGGDGLLSQQDIEDAAKNGKGDAKDAAKWLSDETSFDTVQSSGGQAQKEEDAIRYLRDNYDEFDTGAGIGKKDNKVSIKDLRGLANSDDKEMAKNAQTLMDIDIIGKLSGDDKYISKEEVDEYFETTSNGEIDDFSQTNEGNCWWLVGSGALGNSEEGRRIIKDSITDKGDGSYEVVFRGDENNETFTVTQKDLDRNGVKGDRDMGILNEAARKYYKKNEDKDIGDGGQRSDALELITGQKPTNIESKEQLKEYYDRNKDNGHLITFSSKPGDGGSAQMEGAGHAYIVEDIDFGSNKVTYVNPWDTSKKHTTSVDKFLDLKEKSPNKPSFVDFDPPPKAKPTSANPTVPPGKPKDPTDGPQSQPTSSGVGPGQGGNNDPISQILNGLRERVA